jgi:hypothetical protein
VRRLPHHAPFEAPIRVACCLRALPVALVACALQPGCGTHGEPVSSGGLDAQVPLQLMEGGAPSDAASSDAALGERDAAALDAGVDLGLAPGTHVCGLVTNKVDLLLVVDNSGSMAEEQALLAAQLPRMIYALGHGDLDGDGVAEYRPADLHVAVVSSDMGVTGTTTGCTPFGDDGMFVDRCAAGGEHFLRYGSDVDAGAPVDAGVLRDADGGVLDASAADFAVARDPALLRLSCMVELGTSGCGLEAQLDSALKALTPSSSPLRFQRGTAGFGDAENAGFLRRDSVLAIVVVSDEDDCSLPGTEPDFVLQNGGSFSSTHINLRCYTLQQHLRPLSRYIDGFAALRENPNAFVFGLIGGVPKDLSGQEASAILEDERMTPRPNDAGQEVVPVCTRDPDAGIGRTNGAMPAPRLVGVAAAFGERAVVTSICEDTFARPAEALLRRISGVLACPDMPLR